MYLERFVLPATQELESGLLRRHSAQNGGITDNPYPCGLFPEKELPEISFKNITVFYGGNGSGKSTLLNLISEKLKLNRVAPYNSGEMFGAYVAACTYTLGYDDEGFPLRVPNGSRIITSDDIFDYMLTVRGNNGEIAQNREEAKADWGRLHYGDSIRISGMHDYEALRLQVLARQKTRRQFIRSAAGSETRLTSNGETALRYFEEKLKSNTLYCLDEPENSLSPKLQIELGNMLEKMARYCGCQFIVATHSPFLLAMQGARIYDLDARPCEIREWWELENVRIYFEFFQKHSHLFRRGGYGV